MYHEVHINITRVQCTYSVLVTVTARGFASPSQSQAPHSHNSHFIGALNYTVTLTSGSTDATVVSLLHLGHLVGLVAFIRCDLDAFTFCIAVASLGDIQPTQQC